MNSIKNYCLGARCVSTGISYGLKKGNFSYFLFVYINFISSFSLDAYKFHFWEHVVSAHGAATDLNRESLEFFFLLFILILCIPVHEKHKHFLFGSTLCRLRNQIWPKTGGEFLFIFFNINFISSISLYA